MKNKLAILFIFVFIFSIFSRVVSADILLPGEKPVNWCYEISNINDYPNYVFIFNHEYRGPKVVNQGDCFNFYKFGSNGIYAIPKADFNEGELNIESFGETEPSLIKSNIQLDDIGPLKENDPLQAVVVTLRIQSLSGDIFDIQKSKVTYTYTDGMSEEKVFQSQEIMPKPSRTAVFPWWFARFWYVILPMLAIVLTGVVLLARRLKK